jgi:dCMP deaminase
MKAKFVNAYMDVADRFSKLSSAKRLQVGAIVVKDDRIISIGYNGMPSGWDNNCEYEVTEFQTEYGVGSKLIKTGELKTRPEVLHAESNAIAKLARSSESGDGATLFVTHQPCMECAKLIYQSGIKEVYYSQPYRLNDGLDFLQKSNINVTKVEKGS